MFPSEGLETNQRGELTDAQRGNFAKAVRERRRGRASMALVFAAIGAIVVFGASPKKAAAARVAVPPIAFAIAFLILVVPDPLAGDARAGRVEHREGAIGKRRVGNGRARSSYFLEVGDRRFRVARSTYEAAPDAGYVRIYYLPRSRKLVNLEPLPDRAIDPVTVTRGDLLHGLAAFARAHGRQERNEARADLHAFEAAFTQPPMRPPPDQHDPRPLAQAIVGRWTNGFISVVFAADGTVIVHIGGHEQRSRWSVDAAGHLHADLAGAPQSADAWVAGDRLTIASDGRGLTFQRERD